MLGEDYVRKYPTAASEASTLAWKCHRGNVAGSSMLTTGCEKPVWTTTASSNGSRARAGFGLAVVSWTRSSHLASGYHPICEKGR